MPRLVYLAGVGLVLVALAFVVTDATLIRPQPGATEANVRRVRPGMTIREVEAIVGILYSAARDQTIDHAPLVIFAVVLGVLFLLMLRL